MCSESTTKYEAFLFFFPGNVCCSLYLVITISDPSNLSLCIRHACLLGSSIFHRGGLLEAENDMMLAYRK